MHLQILPTFHGYILSVEDALGVIEAALSGKLPLVHRRPVERERPDLIKLGNVFVFVEEASNIKRWTDSLTWSASRILGPFLIYRELERGAARKTGEKERFIPDKHSSLISTPNAETDLSASASTANNSPIRSQFNSVYSDNSLFLESKSHIEDGRWTLLSRQSSESRLQDRALMKKTLSVFIPAAESGTGGPKTVHLVSYFSPRDILTGNLSRPSQSQPELSQISLKLWLALKHSSNKSDFACEKETNLYLDSQLQLRTISIMEQKIRKSTQNQRPYSGGTSRRHSSFSPESLSTSNSMTHLDPYPQPPLSTPSHYTQMAMTGDFSRFHRERQFVRDENQVGFKEAHMSSIPPQSSGETWDSAATYHMHNSPHLGYPSVHHHNPLFDYGSMLGNNERYLTPDTPASYTVSPNISSIDMSYRGIGVSAEISSGSFPFHPGKQNYGQVCDTFHSSDVTPAYNNYGTQTTQEDPSSFFNGRPNFNNPHKAGNLFPQTDQTFFSTPTHALTNGNFEPHHSVHSEGNDEENRHSNN